MEVERTMMTYRRSTPRNGFTIIEVMIAVAISSVLVAAVYQTFHSLQWSYTQQNEVAAIEQNLRGALYLLTRELRSAGYNPNPKSNNNFRIVTSFPAPNNLFTVNYAGDHFTIAFTLDADGSSNIESDRNEQIAYKFEKTTKTLQRFNDKQADITKKWEIVASNIDAVYFAYFDRNNISTNDPASIEYVEISLLARMAKQDNKYKDETAYCIADGFIKTKCDTPLVPLCPLVSNTCINNAFGDHYHRRLWTTTIQIRNKLFTPS